MFASGNSTPRHAEAFAENDSRKALSAMQIMLIILGVLVAPMILGLVFNRPANQTTAAAAYPVQPGGNARNDAIGFYKLVQQTTAQCDLAGGFRAIATLSAKMSGDPVSVYDAAKKEDAICLDVDDHLKALQIPQSVGRSTAQGFAQALEHCENAYLSQWSAAHALANALNSGGKMEDVATFRDSDAASKVENSACYDGLKSAAAPLGVTEDDLTPAPSQGDQQDVASQRASLPADTATNASAADDQSATTSNLTEYSFSDFPSEGFSGPAVTPNFAGAQRQFREYRTMISDGVKQGPVFAGSVAISVFGCGTDCSMGYVADLKNGTVVPLPVGGEANSDMVLEYHPESRLLKAAWKGALSGDSGDATACAGFAYFEWTGHEFRTLKASAHSPACL